MELYLIRHTTPAVDKGICYGQSDIPLKETFEEEWLTLKQHLPSTVNAIYTSPYTRCNSLAVKIGEHINCVVYKDERLAELNFGVWEMKLWSEIDRAESDHWMEDYEQRRCPGGESYNDLILRVKNFLSELQSTSNDAVIIVTHGGIIRAVNSIIKKVPLAASMDMTVAFGGVYRFSMQ